MKRTDKCKYYGHNYGPMKQENVVINGRRYKEQSGICKRCKFERVYLIGMPTNLESFLMEYSPI